MVSSKAVGATTKILRIINRVSIDTAARECLLSPELFKNVENGNEQFLAAQIVEVSKALKVSVDCFFSWVIALDSLPSDGFEKLVNSISEEQIKLLHE